MSGSLRGNGDRAVVRSFYFCRMQGWGDLWGELAEHASSFQSQIATQASTDNYTWPYRNPQVTLGYPNESPAALLC